MIQAQEQREINEEEEEEEEEEEVYCFYTMTFLPCMATKKVTSF